MAEQDRDREIREELKRAQAAPRRGGVLRRVAWMALVLVAVLGAVAFAAHRNLGSMDSIRRMLSYNKVNQDADGKAELFRFDSDRSNRYAMLGDDLLIVSTTRVLLLSDKGAEIYSQAVSFTNPAIELGGQTAAVYDVGGSVLLVLSHRGLVRDMSAESGNGILSVSLNSSDYLALTAMKSNYRSTVTVYNDAGEALFTFNSRERYVTDACVLNDCHHVAAVTLGEEEGAFASSLTLYVLDSESPLNTTTLSGSLVISLRNAGGVLAALENDQVTMLDTDGALAGSYRYEYPYLRGQSFGGTDFVALLLSRYRSGSAYRLVTVGVDGETLGTLDERKEILDVSAAGRYVAVLYNDSLTVYTSNLTEYATLQDTGFARKAIMRSDGTVLLIGSSRASLFIP